MKSTDRKILFFDIDGTLITEDGRRYFPDSARHALAQARANGHLVFIDRKSTRLNSSHPSSSRMPSSA